MESNYYPIYQPGLPPGSKFFPFSTQIREQLPCIGLKIHAKNGTVVYCRCLGHNVPILLWEIKKCSERDSVDSSQGLLLGMEFTLKLLELCPEIICIIILEPYKNTHIFF